MKRLAYFIIGAFSLTASAQSYSVKNANKEYVVSNIYEKNFTEKPLYKIIRDESGLYWFQSVSEFFSFDGINWKRYRLQSGNGKNNPVKANDIEVMEDGTIWLATSAGIYILERASEIFVPIGQKFPGINAFPSAVSCFYKGLAGNLIFTSAVKDGFYLMDLKTKSLRHIIIDSIIKTEIQGGEIIKITSDRKNNVWGITSDNSGIWKYNYLTGKILCSWKGELPQFAAKRFQNVISLTYSANEDALWLSYGDRGYLEKMNMQTGKSIFYSFNGNLKVQPDSVAYDKYSLFHVKIDKDNNEWIKVGEKYLVKLNKDISHLEYLVNDHNALPIGDWGWFKPENGITNPSIKDNKILLWIEGIGKLSMIKKRGSIVRHIPFDTLSSTAIKPEDYINDINGHQTIYFEKGRDDHYFILQKNTGRPKLICLDNNLRIKKALFNDEWKQYPAFFSKEFNPDTFFIAFMRPKVESIDFRNQIIKEFRVDLRTFKSEEMNLSFSQRVWRYGYADANNVYWLFSNGFLYSYNPSKNILDSVYISEPAAKGSYKLDLVKGYDYPAVLHKKSSTFWIDFIPTRELYRINLKTKKIDKVFKCCIDQKDCNIPGGVFDLYNFDDDRIYLQQSYSALLLNTTNDSLTNYSDLFQNKLAVELQNGSGVYKNWICLVLPSYIYFLNSITGRQKELKFNEDFKWQTSQLNSRPLVNDRGEMILMSSSHRGFLVFNIDSIPDPEKPGIVRFSFITLDNKHLPVDSLIKKGTFALKFNDYKSIQIGFSDNSVFDPANNNYEYILYKGGDTVWNKIDGKPELTFSEITPGKYQLLLRAGNGFGDYSEKITAFPVEIIPPFWQTIWFKVIALAAIGFIFYGLYRYRLGQMKKVQIIRNSIASDLHDDIGSTLNSISIYSEVAKQQAGKEIPALDMIGINSRKIIESMSDIVWTINAANDSFEKIIVRMRSFAYQLLKAKQVEYTFEVDEKLNSVALPMQVRKNFYLVFKEAITNVVKYSEASRVSILLYEKNKIIMLRIRDNGKGIPVNAQTLGNGLMNMTRRAKEISAELNIISANNGGTEIELMLKT